MNHRTTIADPLQLLAGMSRPAIFLGLLFAMVVLGNIMRRSLAPAKAAARALGATRKSRGILDLEFAHDGAAGAQLAKLWGSRGRVLAAFNVGLDTLFILGYVALLALGCRMAADGFVHSGATTLATVGPFVAWAAVAAGLLDAVENCGVLAMIEGRGDSAVARYTCWCAGAKFALVGCAAVYVFGATCALRSRFFT